MIINSCLKKVQKTIELWELTMDELSPDQYKVVKEAEEALKSSYAPYSHFPVGAAILLKNGSIIKGSNQENAAYPSGLCAERTALFHYGAGQYNSEIDSIAVVVEKEKEGEFPFPCGSCLQVMVEFAQRQTSPYNILLYHRKSGKVLMSNTVENMLPFAFRKEHLPG
ncbi:MAG TPA: cytidine deaminase [Cryomorphaceae bacterium]|nr:cytidine deaminase [Owenweeksia sp.]MBG00419.1 cytidine deaminase [Owenweeksia sp.]HAD96693.1 cytidine deaminase [Cryomorphaceae bacterium]HBF20778.1 cytidine deaminase [Cryomorphaceae bacterium]